MNLQQEIQSEVARALSRRWFLGQCSLGLGSLALADEKAGPPTVDVTLQIQEGKQYFVNRIIFTGNTTTRDNVISTVGLEFPLPR